MTKLKKNKKKQNAFNGGVRKAREMKNKMKVIPLGGINEIGKNMTLYEYNDQIIVVDMGLKFPDEELLGIDLVINNWNYLIENRHKLKGAIVTHGHEDHIGAIPYFLKDFDTPIYATKLTMGLIESKLSEHKYNFKPRLVVISSEREFKIGDFTITPISVTHSIPDCVAFSIKTDVGTIIHTGDFKVDYTPIDGRMMDLQKFADIGSNGVMAMLADSTNALRPGFTISEANVGETFEKIFRKATKSRIIIASFSSNVHRVQQVINVAYSNHRKIAISGRSMGNVFEIATRLGYLSIPDPNMIIDIKDVDGYPDNEICVITTGSQGETFSALTRMSNDSHANMQIREGDTVIFSSTPIPGNEKSVNRVINRLYEKGAEVIYHDLERVHVSGHACQEELKLIHNLVKPQFFIPVHGEYAHLKEHAQIAQLSGTSRDNIFIVENGSVIEFTNNKGKISAQVVDKVEAGPVLIDGLGVGDVGNIVLRDRKILSEEGLIVLVMPLGEGNKVVSKFDLITRGFVYVRNSEEFLTDARDHVQEVISKYVSDGSKERNSIKKRAKAELGDYIYQSMRRRPMILTIVVDACGKANEEVNE